MFNVEPGSDHAPGIWDVVKELLPKGKKKIVDLGCGSWKWYFPEYEIHNCDILAQRKENFKQADLNKDFPYENEEFDGIIAIEIVEHLENIWHFFRECHRILKKNGFIIFTVPNYESEVGKARFLSSGIEHITPVFQWQIEYICDLIGFKLLDVKYNNKDEEIKIVKMEKI
jgi:SAM-dependent methyltransferase